MPVTGSVGRLVAAAAAGVAVVAVVAAAAGVVADGPADSFPEHLD